MAVKVTRSVCVDEGLVVGGQLYSEWPSMAMVAAR